MKTWGQEIPLKFHGNKRSQVTPASWIESLEQRQFLSVTAPTARHARARHHHHAATTVAAAAPTAASTVAGSVTGVVTDANGNPLTSAEVVIIPSAAGSAAVATAKTTPNGSYLFGTVPAGTYVIKAYSTGFQSSTSAVFTVAAGSNFAPPIKLALAASVSGGVTDANGVALGGASVGLVPAATPTAAAVATATTSSTGQYNFTTVTPGNYIVRAGKTGYASAASAPFSANAGTNAGPTLKLTAIVYGSVTGSVTDANGVPIANASVLIASSPTTSTNAQEAKTDAGGNYTFATVPVGTAYVVRAYATSFLSATSALFPVNAGSNTAPALKLGIAASVAGTITDAGGNALAGVSVAIVSAATPTGSAVATLTTNAAGQYLFGSVPLGAYIVRASKTGYFSAASAAFTANAGSNTAPTLKLTAIVYGSVTGTITDTNGNPIAGASVSVIPSSSGAASTAEVKTDASGNYTLPKVQAGTYAVRASAPGYLGGTSPTFVVQQGANVAPTLMLTQAATVAGTITDANGKPIAGASVYLVPPTGTTATVAGVKTDASGNYVLNNVPAGSYTVRAYATGYLSATSAAFSVVPGSNAAPTLALTQAATLTGTVTDANGKAIAGASVYVVPPSGATATTTEVKTDASGGYTFSGLAAGSYTVRAYATGYFSATSPAFNIVPGNNTAPTLKLAQATVVGGSVTDAAGNALAGASVSIVNAATPTGSALATLSTNANGQYTFSSLQPGTYVLRVAKSGFASAVSPSFTVAVGSNTAPTVKLTALVTGSVAGTIIDDEGDAVPNASVYIVSTTAGTSQAFGGHTDANGNYLFANVPVGSYVIRAYESGYGSANSVAFTVIQGSNTVPTLQLVPGPVV